MREREVVKAIEADGWYLKRTKSSHKIFRHPTEPGIVVVAGHAGRDLPIGQIADIEMKSGVTLRSANAPAILPGAAGQGSRKPRPGGGDLP